MTFPTLFQRGLSRPINHLFAADKKTYSSDPFKTSMTVTSSSSPEPIKNWILIIQLALFAILYAVWALPETILIRHVCLIAGALIGVYEIFCFRHLVFRKISCATAPMYLLFGLFVWASFHLFFLSNNFGLQMEEYSSIWKRTALGAIFALGLGLALANVSASVDPQRSRMGWPIFYLGLLAPTLIYILKYCLTHYGQRWGINAPDFLKLHYGSLPFYLPKTAYVCFCLPALAVALGQLRRNIHDHISFSFGNLVYVVTIPAIFFVFYGENIKNGVVYGVFLVAIFAILILLMGFRKHWLQRTLLTATFLALGAAFVVNHIQKNESWRTLAADSKVALNIGSFDQWKFNGAKGYPNNELGKMVSVTNYERIAWGKAGLILLAEHPLGYGLIERSFGHLAKSKWPESALHQSHSGWLDLALGIGIPGTLLVLTSLLLAMWRMCRIRIVPGSAKDQNPAKAPQSPWFSACWWILLASLVMWCTTEISQKVFFDSLIFWVALGAGLSAGVRTSNKRGVKASQD